MRYTFITLIAFVFLFATSLAQDEGTFNTADKASETTLHSYVVQLTEFRWKGSADPVLNPRELARTVDELRKDGKIDVIETVSLSALENHESMAQFGRDVAVPIERGQVRNIQFQQVGTMVKLLVVPENGKVALGLQYEASRLGGEGADDLPPSTLRTQFKTKLMIDLGTPTLVGSTTAQPASLLMVSITQR